MKKFFSKNGILLLCAAVVISLGLCILSAVGSNSGFLRNAVGIILTPFRSVGATVTGWVEQMGDRFDSADALKEENQELRAQIAKLEEEIRQAEKDSAENVRLRNLLNLRQQRRDFTFESARITEHSVSNWASTLTLSKGTSHGIAIGDCVVSDEGYLVGIVAQVGLNWCTVTTILDTDCQLGAKVFRTGEITVASGDLKLMDSNRLKLSYLSDGGNLVGGDLILTSGLGGHYPPDLVIGSVEEMKTDDNGLTKYAILAPKVRLDELEEVFVITDFDVID